MNDRQGPGRQLEDTLIWTIFMICIARLTVSQQHDGSVELAQGIVVGVSFERMKLAFVIPSDRLTFYCS